MYVVPAELSATNIVCPDKKGALSVCSKRNMTRIISYKEIHEKPELENKEEIPTATPKPMFKTFALPK